MIDYKNENATDLAYFISLQEKQPEDVLEFSSEKWDQRAEFWKKERMQKKKGDERVISAISYLEERGLLQKQFDVVDIGCGPGRFATAFAHRVHQVVGLDFSEKMVAHGMEYLKQEHVTNATLRTCDFDTLDIDKEGYRGAFDVVFSSMTPALRGIENIKKSIEMSRGWCCHITHLSGRNYLREQILQEVFGKQPVCQWTGQWFYALFNILFLSGYNPETSYETRHQEIWVQPDEKYVDFLMEHMLPQKEITTANAKKIQTWLQAHQNQDGKILDVRDTTYGRLLWDVRNPVKRPAYAPTCQKIPVRHVFLTGPKKIGKSTLIRTVLKHFSGNIGGFCTIKTDRYLKDKNTVHLFPIGQPMIPSEKNLLFLCGSSDIDSDLRFDRLGSQALQTSKDCSLILMDELGPHEAGAKHFHQTVLDTLNGPVPVLGVLQKPTDPFWSDITNRSDVRVIEISEDNRDQTSLVKTIENILFK